MSECIMLIKTKLDEMRYDWFLKSLHSPLLHVASAHKQAHDKTVEQCKTQGGRPSGRCLQVHDNVMEVWQQLQDKNSPRAVVLDPELITQGAITSITGLFKTAERMQEGIFPPY